MDYFGDRYFGPRYYGAQYWGPASGVSAGGGINGELSDFGLETAYASARLARRRLADDDDIAAIVAAMLGGGD